MDFFKNKVFRKLFFIYSAVIISVIVSLSAFILKNIKDTLISNQIYLNRKMIDNINDYFKQQNESSKIQINSLYGKTIELWDIINFLNYDYEKYIKMRLDNYSMYEGYMYGGINSFVKNAYNSNSNIENIIFYSLKNDKFAIFNSLGQIKYEYDIKKNIGFDISEENIDKKFVDILKSYNEDDKGKYYYTLSKIKDPYKLETVGFIVFKYKLDGLNNIINNYEKAKNNIIVISKKGEVIYDSLNKYTDKTYPYIDRLKTTDKPVQLDKESYIDLATSALDVIVVGVLPVDNILAGNKLISRTTYSLAIFLILIAEFIAFIKIDGLSKRVNNIISAMKAVQKGNLKVNIPADKEDDEFTMISDSFNDMCKKLDNYINRVYLSEIKQKNAEMMALQSQINPHFLYNTLESIRMKAISNGDRETGKMLYNLAALYRNMIKGKTFITIAQEIEHCKLYLELFKFRYEGKFDYCIDVEEDLYSKEIIKFSIQPIIENFIVHGIDIDRDDNYIVITSYIEDNNAVISVQDNGRGIQEEKLKSINEKLKTLEHNESIGLVNVHERIALTYGDKYGLGIESQLYRGTVVNIKIPIKEA